MPSSYGADLAYIHHVGFGAYARCAGAGVLRLLHSRGIERGRIVDLGCGSGIWAKMLTDRGYEVIGVDRSRNMVSLARKQAPRAKFIRASMHDFEIPACVAVTCLGEGVNYMLDECGVGQLSTLFRAIRKALVPDGLFVFDVIEPGVCTAPEKKWTEGEGWAVMVENSEIDDVLTRRIVTFRKAGACYRRSVEVHRQRLIGREKVRVVLERIGFSVRYTRKLGDYKLMPGRVAFIARKGS